MTYQERAEQALAHANPQEGQSPNDRAQYALEAIAYALLHLAAEVSEVRASVSNVQVTIERIADRA